MNLETTGEISVAIPVIFSLLLLFLFLFLFTTRNFSLKQTFTPAAVVLFSIYTAVVIGLWGFFLNQKRDQHQESVSQPLLPAAMTDSVQADFSDEIIIHNDTLPIPTRYSHLPKDATPIPDFNYRQDIVPRTIAERLHHFRQIHDIEKRRKNMLELEVKKTDPNHSPKESIQQELLFLQLKHDRFLSIVIRNLTAAAKQRNLRNSARIRQYDKGLTDYLKQRIETFLSKHKNRQFTRQDYRMINGFIQEILSSDIDPNMVVTDRNFPAYSGPLLKAVLGGRFPETNEMLTALLRKNADVNIKIDLPSPADLPFYLKYTMQHGLENVDTFQGRNILLTLAKNPMFTVRDLISPILFGADVLPVDEVGRTALHYIAMRGDAIPLFQFLIYSGAEINAMDRDGFTPLMLSYFSPNPNAVLEMEQFSPDQDIINRFGAKAKDYATQRKLILAVVNNHPSEVQKALDGGADPYQVLYMKLNLFQLACFHEAVESVDVLLKNGVNPNILPASETALGRLPLHIALKKNNLRLFELLLNRNANYKTQVLCIHQRPYPLIHFTCEVTTGKPFLKLLIEAGADINSRSRKQETPLMKAVNIPQNEEIIRFLLENGADVNAQDVTGRTALMNAAFFGRESHVRLLLEAGADPRIKTKSGRTAIDFTGQQNIRELLTHSSSGKQN